MEILNTRMFKWKKKNPTATGIAKHMDIILLNINVIIYNKPLDLAKTIFINMRLESQLVIYFIDNILEILKQPVNIIIAGEDYTFPNNIDVRYKSPDDDRLQDFRTLGQHKMINKIFVENLDEDIENAIPIPLGLNPKECPTNFDYFLQFENIDRNKPLKFTNFNRTRGGGGQWAERGHVKNLCMNNWNDLYVHFGKTDHKNYLESMGSYLFTICVHGGGLDVNPKLWEAILIGVIPIIRENKPYTDIYKKLDFPVVIVKNWDVDTINENNLTLWYNKYYTYFEDNVRRQQMLKALSLDYWINYVNDFE